jgi:hypothetical protein
MRNAIALLSAVFSAILLSATPAGAQPRIQSDLAHHPFATDFPAGGQLELHIRSAEIHIVGSDKNELAVRVSGRAGQSSTDMKAQFERQGSAGELRVTGGPSHEVSITVQVPKKSNLRVRIFAGDVEIEGISGNKDVDLSAGNLTIAVGDPADYSHVSASVTTGSIEAEPFGESHGGMFRSFSKSGNGEYRLVAHVGSGDLSLR